MDPMTKLYDTVCFVLSFLRDMKPDNILLDDNGESIGTVGRVPLYS